MPATEGWGNRKKRARIDDDEGMSSRAVRHNGVSCDEMSDKYEAHMALQGRQDADRLGSPMRGEQSIYATGQRQGKTQTHATVARTTNSQNANSRHTIVVGGSGQAASSSMTIGNILLEESSLGHHYTEKSTHSNGDVTRYETNGDGSTTGPARPVTSQTTTSTVPIPADTQSPLHDLSRQQRPTSLTDAKYEVIHCIDDGNKAGTRYFLGSSFWVTAGTGRKVTAEMPTVDPITFIKSNPWLDFVVLFYYFNAAGKEHMVPRIPHQDSAQTPKFYKEVVRLVSKDLIAGMKNFCEQVDITPDLSVIMDAENQLLSPYAWWYWFRQSGQPIPELPERQAALVKNLVQWIDNRSNKFYDNCDRLFQRGDVCPMSMGLLVRPGDVVVYDEAGITRAAVASTSYYPSITTNKKTTTFHSCENGAPGQEEPKHSWLIDIVSYEYNGKLWRMATTKKMTVRAEMADSQVAIRNLPIRPLKYSEKSVEELLRRRGTVFWSCLTKSLVAYANSEKGHASQGQRFMIDYETYIEQNAQTNPEGGMSVSLSRWTDVPGDPDIYLFPPVIQGFSLQRNKWEELAVDAIRDVTWQKQAFSALAADEETKRLLQAVVTKQLLRERGADLVQRTANGHIILLHGGTGTGKTFTAESVAELAERPLMTLPLESLISLSRGVENRFEHTLELAEAWGGILLLDHADMLFEDMATHVLFPPSFASMLIRILEEYNGTTIICCRHAGNIPEALRSRVQLALHYKKLTQSQRARIWRNSFNQLKSVGEDQINYDEVHDCIGELSEFEMNGHQIRNQITTARQLAQLDDVKMSVEHLRQAIKVNENSAKFLSN